MDNAIATPRKFQVDIAAGAKHLAGAAFQAPLVVHLNERSLFTSRRNKDPTGTEVKALPTLAEVATLVLAFHPNMAEVRIHPELV